MQISRVIGDQYFGCLHAGVGAAHTKRGNREEGSATLRSYYCLERSVFTHAHASWCRDLLEQTEMDQKA